MFKILQWNCRGFLSKFAEISSLIGNFQVICLQETWLNHTNNVSFKDHCVFRSDRPPPRCGGGGGVLIPCKKDLEPILLKSDKIKVSGCNLVVISILDKRLGDERILVASIYKPPDINFSYKQWRDVLDGLIHIGTSPHIIVMGTLTLKMKHGVHQKIMTQVYH